MFKKILIANRGEIALRILRTCRANGIGTVAVYSSADADSPHLALADETVCIGGAPAGKSYLNMDAILQAAMQYECQAVHPGYGFLAENELFARRCEQQKTTFIGPPPQAIALMGDKVAARRAMRKAGIDPVPGSYYSIAAVEHAIEEADRIGYPVMLKARAGGGGKGMRRCEGEAQLREMFPQAMMEAEKAFGDNGMYLEKCIDNGRHIEFQILVDAFGNAIHLGERECSVQRSHQKLVEESPSPAINTTIREHIGDRVKQAVVEIGYRNAGTMEFIMDADGHLYFMEMNTRLQVEHPVTEMLTGMDLVKEQILIAANHRLSYRQEEVCFSGHALECRINAEDPFNGFMGSPGVISVFEPPPLDETVRLDTHAEAGVSIPPFYDSMIGKLVVRGADRDSAIQRMRTALRSLRIEGIKTTIPLHLLILESAAFAGGAYTTALVPELLAARRGGF
ncbi:acetyl-CoA carboxylase biotin carboxylase subunit [bacterium]|nr:acetyl-CoA carboxylase biotin carboxylase subunit [candidate division CSSED10-310 bacterium]